MLLIIFLALLVCNGPGTDMALFGLPIDNYTNMMSYTLEPYTVESSITGLSTGGFVSNPYVHDSHYVPHRTYVRNHNPVKRQMMWNVMDFGLHTRCMQTQV